MAKKKTDEPVSGDAAATPETVPVPTETPREARARKAAEKAAAREAKLAESRARDLEEAQQKAESGEPKAEVLTTPETEPPASG